MESHILTILFLKCIFQILQVYYPDLSSVSVHAIQICGEEGEEQTLAEASVDGCLLLVSNLDC